jgi:lysophospholipase L1-like esterase/ketosteroid isomerase-like protein
MRVDQVTVNDKLAQVAAPLLISARSSATDNYVKRAVIVSLTTSLLFAVTGGTQLVAAQSVSPPGVETLLQRFDSTASGATALDVSARAALFTGDASFVDPFGNRVEGRPALDSLLARLASSSDLGRTRSERLQRRIRLLAPDLVLVDQLERVTTERAAGARANPARMTHITIILRQIRPAEWRIVYYRAGDDRSLELEKRQRVTQDALENDWANLGRYRDANAKLPAPAPNENRVVFYGNSITEGFAPRFPTMFPGKPYIGRGISGQTTPQLLVRFNQDVVALKPKVVVILAGTNDIAGNTGPSTIEMIENNLRSMAEIAKAHRIRVVLSSVLPVYDYVWRPGLEPAPRIIALNAWIKDYAAKNGAVYLDYHTAMSDSRGGMRDGLSSDGVHPTEAGYRVMAPLAAAAIARALR